MSDSEETKEILERIADAFESFGSNLDEKYPKEAVRPGTIVRANRVDSLGVVTDAFYGELDEDNQKIIIYTILLFPKRNYLNQRRDEQYYISNEYEYVNRIIFPSFCEDMKLNYFLSRTYDETEKRKYKNCKIQRKDIIFNEHLIEWDRQVVLVEGVFDAIKAGDNSIPMLGSWIDESHYLFKKIVQERTPVVLGLDPDAIEKTMKIAKNLKQYGINVRISQHEDKDFGDMTNDEANYYIQSAQKYELTDRIGYLIQSISSGSIF